MGIYGVDESVLNCFLTSCVTINRRVQIESNGFYSSNNNHRFKTTAVEIFLIPFQQSDHG